MENENASRVRAGVLNARRPGLGMVGVKGALWAGAVTTWLAVALGWSGVGPGGGVLHGVLLGFLALMGSLACGVGLRHVQRWERRRREAEARDAAEAAAGWRVDMAADLGHELRTPLHGVIGMLSLLRDTSMDTTQADYVDGALNSANHLMAVLNNVVDLSRIEAGRMELQLEPVDLARLVRDVGGLASPMAKSKGLRFHTRVDDAVPRWVRMDATRVRQVLFNLLSNAVKFTDHGELHLTVTMGGAAAGGAGLLRFEVRDQGVGMDGPTVASLFQRFARGAGTAGRRTEGAGLGLQISLALARLMRGDILVTSQPGVGSTFDLVLPCEPCTEPEAHSARNGVIVAAAGTLRVLVAEDHPVNRRYLAALLARMGHEAVICSHGAEAVEAAATGDFDIVLLDVRMPVLDGWEAARRIRALRPQGERLPIVALTADATAEARRRTVEAGMDEFLAKPVRPAELALVLERMGGRNSHAPGSHGSVRDDARRPQGMAEMEELSESLGVQGYRDLVFDLCDEGGPTLAGLRKALDTGDAEAIAGKAHEIKGAALTLGLGVMAAVAQDLEDAREDVERREAHWIRLVALLPGLRAHAISASRRDA